MDERAATAKEKARKQLVHNHNNASLVKYTHANAFILLSAKWSVL